MFNAGRTSIRAYANSLIALSRTQTRVLQNYTSGPVTLSSNNTGSVVTISPGVTSNPGNVHILPAIFNPGDIIRLFNNTNTAVTLTQNTGVTLYLPNTANILATALTGNRTLGPRGYITLTTVAANTFIISGIGIN